MLIILNWCQSIHTTKDTDTSITLLVPSIDTRISWMNEIKKQPSVDGHDPENSS